MRSSKVTRWIVVATTAAAFTLSVLVSGGTAASAAEGSTSVATVDVGVTSDTTSQPDYNLTVQPDDFVWV